MSVPESADAWALLWLADSGQKQVSGAVKPSCLCNKLLVPNLNPLVVSSGQAEFSAAGGLRTLKHEHLP